jgi:hypothetical protein
MAGWVMADCDCVLDHSHTLGDSLLLCAVRKAAYVHGVDGRDVPNWLDHHACVAGARLLWMDHTYWPVDTTVWV